MRRRLQFDFKRATYVPIALTVLLFMTVFWRFESAYEQSRQTDWLAAYLLFSAILLALFIVMVIQNVVRQRFETLDGMYHRALRDLSARNAERSRLIAKIESLQSRAVKLTESKKDLKQDISHRDVFLSVATHELKTPLTSLKLQLQLTKRRNDLRSTQLLRAMDICLLQTKRIEVLVDGLLDVSNIPPTKVKF